MTSRDIEVFKVLDQLLRRLYTWKILIIYFSPNNGWIFLVCIIFIWLIWLRLALTLLNASCYGSHRSWFQTSPKTTSEAM